MRNIIVRIVAKNKLQIEKWEESLTENLIMFSIQDRYREDSYFHIVYSLSFCELDLKTIVNIRNIFEKHRDVFPAIIFKKEEVAMPTIG